MRRIATVCAGVLLASGAALAAAPEYNGPWVVVVRAQTPEQREWLTTQYAPWSVKPARQEFQFAIEDRSEWELIEAAGLEISVDPLHTAKMREQMLRVLPKGGPGIPGFPCYRTVEETLASLDQLEQGFPELVDLIDIGDSWEKQQGTGGHDLTVIRITNESIPGPKPALFAMGGIHAREYAPAEVVLRFGEQLLLGYGQDPDITWIVDHHEIHLLPAANPDGRKQAEGGLLWRKNADNLFCSGSNSRGVDLNRNYPYVWGGAGASTNACSDTFRGPSAGSEPETIAVTDYVRSLFPDARPDDLVTPAPEDTSGLFFDMHSYSELVLWSWGFDGPEAPNAAALRALGRRFAWFNDYMPQPAVDLYPTTGTTDDFAYGELGIPAYTFEMGTSFFQSCPSFESDVLPDNLAALTYAARVVRAPYLEPGGPEARDLVLGPAQIEPGETLTLSAVVDDSRFSGNNGAEPVQSIVSAEAFVATTPWTAAKGTGIPLAAADGSFNTSVEAVTGELVLPDLPAGRHLVYVRGRDASGRDGPLTAAFIDVIPSGTTGVVQGVVTDVATAQPIAADISSADASSQAEAGTGEYRIRLQPGNHELLASSPGYCPRVESVQGLALGEERVVDFELEEAPSGEAVNDEAENGNTGWTVESGNWALTTIRAVTPTHSWTDSPSGDYSSNADVRLVSAELDLSQLQGVRLSFHEWCDTEAGFDYGRVEVSGNNGASWTEVARCDGTPSWQARSIELPQLDGVAQARIRFRLTSDVTVVEDGWYLDSIRLSGLAPCPEQPDDDLIFVDDFDPVN